MHTSIHLSQDCDTSMMMTNLTNSNYSILVFYSLSTYVSTRSIHTYSCIFLCIFSAFLPTYVSIYTIYTYIRTYIHTSVCIYACVCYFIVFYFEVASMPITYSLRSTLSPRSSIQTTLVKFKWRTSPLVAFLTPPTSSNQLSNHYIPYGGQSRRCGLGPACALRACVSPRVSAYLYECLWFSIYLCLCIAVFLNVFVFDSTLYIFYTQYVSIFSDLHFDVDLAVHIRGGVGVNIVHTQYSRLQ